MQVYTGREKTQRELKFSQFLVKHTIYQELHTRITKYITLRMYKLGTEETEIRF